MKHNDTKEPSRRGIRGHTSHKRRSVQQYHAITGRAAKSKAGRNAAPTAKVRCVGDGACSVKQPHGSVVALYFGWTAMSGTQHWSCFRRLPISVAHGGNLIWIRCGKVDAFGFSKAFYTSVGKMIIVAVRRLCGPRPIPPHRAAGAIRIVLLRGCLHRPAIPTAAARTQSTGHAHKYPMHTGLPTTKINPGVHRIARLVPDPMSCPIHPQLH